MDNLALKLIDETIDADNFAIDSDKMAEWALKKIAEETAESQRMINICDTFISEYQFKKQQEQERLEKKTAWLKEQLKTYFERVKRKTTKTQETYSLPSGTLKLKYGGLDYKRDEKTLGEFLHSNNYREYFEEVYKPKWQELKKLIGNELTIEGDKLVDTTNGLIIEGVTVSQKDNEFIIEF